MATLPSMPFARALTVGLVGAGVLAGAMFAGLAPPEKPAGPAWASGLVPVIEEPAPPPPPDPMPGAEGPVNQGPANPAPPVRHRRHIDSDPVRSGK
ncbi:hypothetical protein [Mycobacterium sp.]|uniref:hypothetical protein n=1 Tax=Mycobacterium sp. TaxID=1785 RepID=UPI003BB2222D